MIKNLRRVIRYDMIHVAYWEGDLVGYIVMIPDVNWALAASRRAPFDWLRMLQMPSFDSPHAPMPSDCVGRSTRTFEPRGSQCC